MRRKLLSVALSLGSLVAFADVSLYGKVAVGIENDQFQDTTIPGTGSIQDMGSYFGIRGSDPVYGETSAIWQVEQYLDLTTNQAYGSTTAGGMIVPNNGGPSNYLKNQANVLASSETYLGLQGAWGRVRLGNLSNYMRSNMGVVDAYNYNNGVNGMTNYSRTTRLVPTAIRYDSPTWSGFQFAAVYGFDSNNLPGVSSANANNNFGIGDGGVYSGGIYSIGLGWQNNGWSVNLGTMVWEHVGSYQTGANGMNNFANPNSTYDNAYAERLELGYEDPDGIIVGLGFQTTSGLGWASWANSGGSLGFLYNPGTNITGLSNSQLQTQEAAATLGWHIGPWTPKIGYVYGNNLMYGGNVLSVIGGSANQIADSGYTQVLAELDWNITPRTLVFVNYGQAWYGKTLQNISFTGSGGPVAGAVNGSNAFLNNQSSIALGFSNTF